MRIGLVAASAVMVTAIASSLAAQQATPRYYDVREAANAPQIDLWLDQTSYRNGDRITPFFETERGAYVTVIRVTTDGALSVLYPRRPRDQEPYEKGQLINDRVPYSSFDNRFDVNESEGIGFVFAIASFEPFNYSYFNSGGIWNRGRLAYDAVGDPFEIVRRFVDRTLGGGADFSLDYVSYRALDFGTRSRYSTRYAYNSYDDYYSSCYSAFGYRYSAYCYNQYPGYYAPIIVRQPGSPAPVPSSGRNLAGKKIKPVTGDPFVSGAPVSPQPQTEGRLPTNDPAEAAAEASQRARMRREVTPRDRNPSQVEVPVYRSTPAEPPQRADPSPRAEPTPRQFERAPVIRAEPRVEQQRAEPRVEQRVEPRPMPVAPARVEVRNEPASAPMTQSTPRTTATPATKDQN